MKRMTRQEKPKEKTDIAKRCSRPYELGQRAIAMDETRARILTAARELILGKNALAGFSMELVARQAGVTRVTVYNRFESRRGLMEALLDEIGGRSHFGEQLHEILARRDRQEALRAYIELFCQFWDDNRALHRRLRGFAQLDEEFAAAIAARYERHQHAIEVLLRRPNTENFDEAVQTVMALTSFEFYDVLAGSRSSKEVAPIIIRLAESALSRTKPRKAGQS